MMGKSCSREAVGTEPSRHARTRACSLRSAAPCRGPDPDRIDSDSWNALSRWCCPSAPALAAPVHTHHYLIPETLIRTLSIEKECYQRMQP